MIKYLVLAIFLSSCITPKPKGDPILQSDLVAKEKSAKAAANK